MRFIICLKENLEKCDIGDYWKKVCLQSDYMNGDHQEKN